MTITFNLTELQEFIGKIFDFNSLREEVKKLMATVAELQAQVAKLTQASADLQASVDAEKAQVATGLDTLNTTIADLKNQILALQDIINQGATIPQETFDALVAGTDAVVAQAAKVSDIFTPAA